MAWENITSIKKLNVKLETGTIQTNIFGNGRNQIGVVIDIEALDSNNNPVSLTTEEIIKHAWLIDYIDGNRLNWKKDESWNYTDIANDYHTTVSTVVRNKNDNDKDANFHVHFYVQCALNENVRTKAISVEVELTNPSATQKKWSTDYSNTTGFLSSVTIFALNARVHRISDMVFETRDVDQGSYNIKNKYMSCTGIDNPDCYTVSGERTIDWKQKNYYFYIKNQEFYIKNVEYAPYNENEGAHQVSSNAIYNKFPNRGTLKCNYIFNVGYIWHMSDKEQNKNVVVYTNGRGGIGLSYGILQDNLNINIKTNQIKNALCLTRISYEDNSQLIGSPSFWSSTAIAEENLNWSKPTNITIYDQYGNDSKFHAIPKDDGYEIQIFDGDA